METTLVCCIGSFLLMGLLFVALGIRIVRENTRLSVYRLGQYLGDKGTGLVFLLPFIDRGVIKELKAEDEALNSNPE